MRSIRRSGYLALGALAATLFSLAGCANPMQSSGVGSGSSSGSSSSGVQTIWNNGAYGTWFGAAVTEETNSMFYQNPYAAVTDTYTGDPTTMLLIANSAVSPPLGTRFIFFYTPSPADENASAVLGGHIQFDIMLATPETGNLTVGYSSSAGGPACFSTTVPFSALSTTAFTHESLSVPTFTTTPNCADSTVDIQEPFYLGFPDAAANAQIAYVGGIQWTAN